MRLCAPASVNAPGGSTRTLSACTERRRGGGIEDGQWAPEGTAGIGADGRDAPHGRADHLGLNGQD
jgi:hypothetical protein